MFADKAFLQSPEQLGILSQWNAAGLDQVKPWENDKLPEYFDATILKPSSIEMIDSGKHFKLTTDFEGLLRDQINMKSLKMRSIHSGDRLSACGIGLTNQGGQTDDGKRGGFR